MKVGHRYGGHKGLRNHSSLITTSSAVLQAAFLHCAKRSVNQVASAMLAMLAKVPELIRSLAESICSAAGAVFPGLAKTCIAS